MIYKLYFYTPERPSNTLIDADSEQEARLKLKALHPRAIGINHVEEIGRKRRQGTQRPVENQ